MHLWLSLVCLWAVGECVQAQAVTTNPPSEVIGLIIRTLSDRSQDFVNLVDNQQQEHAAHFYKFIQIGSTVVPNVFPADGFWEIMFDHVVESTARVKGIWEKAVEEIAREYYMIIDHPKVRSWMDELSGLFLNAEHLALESIANRRDEWIRMATPYLEEVAELRSDHSCESQQNAKQQVIQLAEEAFGVLESIIEQLKSDHSQIITNAIREGMILVNNIYQVLTLK